MLIVLPPKLAVTSAHQATPAASPDIGRTEDVICSRVIPAAYQPAGDALVEVSRTTIEPGTSVTWTEDSLPLSTGFDCVISGSYSLVIEGEAQVIRGGTGERESYPPGIEIAAEAGDIIFLLENDRTQTYTAVGNEPLVLISVLMASTEPPPCAASDTCPELPPTFSLEWLGGFLPLEWSKTGLQGRDFVATVRRITLESKTSYVITPNQPPLTWFVEEGPVRWTYDGERSEVYTYQRSEGILFTPLAGDEQVTLTNDEADPAVLIELEVAPAAPMSATPAP
jgi:mannose-6-phosphate isomerase-like protein (cupin superfamily)